jgi:glycerol-3-phosphate dehydrogenase
MPVHRDRPEAKLALTVLDAFFDAYDRYQPLKRGKPHTRLSAEELSTLEPGLAGRTVGGVSFDEWGIDGNRLCAANAVDAGRHGATIFNHTTVTRVVVTDGQVRGVEYRDRLTGESGQLSARFVVNATGAWAPLTAELSGQATTKARVRPGKGVHIYYDRRLTNYAIITKSVDGRMMFITPWQNVTVVGTTDTDYYGDLDNLVATADEVRYLTEAAARIFPAIREARAIGTWAGVRPTLYAWGKTPSALSREHEIVHHDGERASGLYSMIGGKLASYRLFAEEMSDILARRLGVSRSSTTHLSPLPGGEETVDPLRLSSDLAIAPIAANRLEYRHGARSLAIAERIQRRPTEAAVVCPCEPVLEAEVRYVVEHEMAKTVEDVSRRTRLGLGACGGLHCGLRCGAIVAEMQQQSPEAGARSALQFLSTARARRAPVVGPVQARQEALTHAALRAQVGSGGMDGAGES